MALTITESWICERVNLKHDNLDDVKSLSLPGSYHEKIVHLGNSLRGFTRLRHLDISRNDISVLDGLDHLKLLETLNLYYNSVTNLKELYKLRYNSNLKEIDLRLNPVTKNEPDYRLFMIHMIPNIKVLDDRSVRDTERKAALSHFVSDQAAEFEPSPPKKEVRDQKSERTSSHARAEMVKNLASRPSVLADDDIALIDLISKADVTNEFGSANQGRKYKAESYDSTELLEIPSPHAEKYAQFRSIGSQNGRPKSREKYHIDFGNDERQRDLKEANSGYDDYHPFATNGNFTPNPSVETRPNQQNYESRAGNVRRNGDYTRNVAVNNDYKTDRGRNEGAGVSPRRNNDSFEMDASRERSRTSQYLVEKSNSKTRFTSSHHARHQNESRQNGEAKPVDDAFVGSSDQREEESFYRAKSQERREKKGPCNEVINSLLHMAITQKRKKLLEKKMDIRPEYEEHFLSRILELVDKYWNGSKSLQTNAKFQTLAKDVISKLVADNPVANNGQNAAGFKRDLETRDKDIAKLHALLREQKAENEKLKKRLQNEEEIQRTIELTDQDLRRLQQKIEEVQAENKALKSNRILAEAERESTDSLHTEIGDLRQCKVSLERENQTLIQQCEQHSTTLTQLQELTSMLQESHRSLVVTNDHLLQELDETRQRHQHEVQQLHWSYEQLKKTAEWLPRTVK